MLKSQEIDKYVHNILFKPYDTKLEQADLDKVKEIVLSKYNIKNEIVEYDYSDLSKLINLEKCSIELLKITDEFIDNINLLQNLKTIEVNACEICSSKKISCHLEKIILQNTDEKLLELFNTFDMELIELIGFKKIDLSIFKRYTNLKDLYIYNSNITNFKQVLCAENLENLKLDGSKLDDEEVLDKISPNIKVQKKARFLLTGL